KEILGQAEEALNPKKKIGERGTKKLYFKEKGFEELFNLEILKKEFNNQKYPKLKIKEEIKQYGKMTFTLVPKKIEKNKRGKVTNVDFSEIVIRENHVNTKRFQELSFEYNRDKAEYNVMQKVYEYIGENDISKKYLGEPAKVYSYPVRAYQTMERESVEERAKMPLDYIVLECLIITEDYTIEINKWIKGGRKNYKEYYKEYEEYLKSIAKALRKK
ncbi:MAG: hypothetical protein ACRC0S_09170, partial [Fusobacteriaceae bacterium]